jgi:ribonuclease HI
MNESLLTLAEVLERYTDGPKEGLFADGSSRPNPGPGGWGVVAVYNDAMVAQKHGHHPDTTNNRMELQALIHAYGMLNADSETVIYTDSQICVNTVNQWAAAWERRGWKRKGGPIKNLELVQELYALAQSRPRVTLRWIKAHQGNRWNEYADALATAWVRQEL